MNKFEQQLILELTRFRDADAERLQACIDQTEDLPLVLGLLMTHRMAAVAYDVLFRHRLDYRMGREMRTSLKKMAAVQRMHNQAYLQALEHIAPVLQSFDFAYALVKGPYLITQVYRPGERTSNDFDLLVPADQLTSIAERLRGDGWIQGYFRDGEPIRPATREQLLSSRLGRGELVPFLKPSSLPLLDVLELDINFSLDHRADRQGVVNNMLQRAVPFQPVAGVTLPTLCLEDFVIQLCVHLFKEATVYKWVELKRDLSLYKFCDLYGVLFDQPDAFYGKLGERIEQLGLEKPCYYALYYTNALYPGFVKSGALDRLLQQMKPDDLSYLKQVTDPAGRRTLQFCCDFIDYLFAPNRAALLGECL